MEAGMMPPRYYVYLRPARGVSSQDTKAFCRVDAPNVRGIAPVTPAFPVLIHIKCRGVLPKDRRAAADYSGSLLACRFRRSTSRAA